MGDDHAHVMTRRRPRWRSYMLLARVSNLPTVWTNVAAGVLVSGGRLEWRALLGLMAGVSLLYVAGMFLNDAFDHAIDAAVRPGRPIPAGDVPRIEAFVVGELLLGTGELLLALSGETLAAAAWGLLLGAAILYYDYRHKRDALGPLVMGLCRGLVYLVAASAAAGISAGVLLAAGVMTAYVTALTLVAKRIGRRGRIVVPLLIAGISIVDALIVVPVAPAAAPWLAAGFLLTLAAQRVVPGD